MNKANLFQQAAQWLVSLVHKPSRDERKARNIERKQAAEFNQQYG